MLHVTPTSLPEVKIIEPKIFEDARGFFFESYNKRDFDHALGTSVAFVQDNQSGSFKGTLRGLHYQIKKTQGKLIRPTTGTIFDVVVDIRGDSNTFGQWTSVILTAESKQLLWIPPGFAHGFLVMSSYAEVFYKTTDYYDADAERCLAWNFNSSIPWPLEEPPILSVKDAQGLTVIEPL